MITSCDQVVLKGSQAGGQLLVTQGPVKGQNVTLKNVETEKVSKTLRENISRLRS